MAEIFPALLQQLSIQWNTGIPGLEYLSDDPSVPLVFQRLPDPGMAGDSRGGEAIRRHCPVAPLRTLAPAGYLGEKRAGSPVDSLSKRERDILQLLVDGRSNRDVARQLSISVKTVETYRSRMLQKLGISNIAELVKFAIAHGLTGVK